ncbi:IclR family transcriptional regulator [Janibacter limosus]|uniref:IclR family transcriptional regulator n=1 Tax=Janibacter limosus TaxID=53458 RepID=UPI00082F7040|nr:IclR family transcriptional regulator [Janibacter limosus]
MTAQPLTRSAAPAAEQQSSAAKVLSVLTAMLHGGRGAVSLSEISLSVGLPKSTTHRLLKVLEDQGFVDRSGALYRLGDIFVDLAESARWSPLDGLRDAAYPLLANLFARSDAVVVHLAVLRGSSIHYVDKLMRPEGVRLPTRVGGRFPAACTALGKAMLAVGPAEALERVLGEPLPRATPYSVTGRGQFLTQLRGVRDAGFVVEREEAAHGFVCVAAPIVSGGQPVAALSVVVPSIEATRAGAGRLGELGRMVSGTAGSVARMLPHEPTVWEVPAAGTVHSLRGRRPVDSPSSSPTTSQE